MVKSSPKSVIGEGPHWDEESQSLYYVDIFGTEYSVLRYCPMENKTYGATIDGEPVVSFIIPLEGRKNQFAVGIGQRVGIIKWNGKSRKAKLSRIALEVENCPGPEYRGNRFNDGKADPHGRVFAGTMRKEECDHPEIQTYGNLFRFGDGEPPATVSDPKSIQISNGLAWNEKRGKMYYINSCDYNVAEFDYDPSTGNIGELKMCLTHGRHDALHFCYVITGNKRSFVNFTTDRGLPDGMTIDTKGNLYVAKFGGGEIVKVNPR